MCWKKTRLDRHRCGIEDSDVPDALDADQDHVMAMTGVAQDDDQRRPVLDQTNSGHSETRSMPGARILWSCDEVSGPSDPN